VTGTGPKKFPGRNGGGGRLGAWKQFKGRWLGGGGEEAVINCPSPRERRGGRSASDRDGGRREGKSNLGKVPLKGNSGHGLKSEIRRPSLLSERVKEQGDRSLPFAGAVLFMGWSPFMRNLSAVVTSRKPSRTATKFGP